MTPSLWIIAAIAACLAGLLVAACVMTRRGRKLGEDDAGEAERSHGHGDTGR